jgi:hypothetical protein
MRYKRFLFLGAFIAASSSAYAGDTLEEYARKCDEAIGVTVPDFSCDSGTEVPDTHQTPASAVYPDGYCDRPNQLNQACDPGSRFQKLPVPADVNAYMVAHCRKKGHSAGDGKYKDIAVIQHNFSNGATCFYQALDENLDGHVKAPSKGISAWPWMTPAQTAGVGCGGCHDNGPIIRSPYLSQVKGADGHPLLPGAGDAYMFNNSGERYYFVGTDFASWKAYEVQVHGNKCNGCHRMGVNNVLSGKGTGRDFGIRATADSSDINDPLTKTLLPHKNKLSADSPMWMIPDDPDGSTLDKYTKANADAAQAIKKCADKFSASSPLPNAPDCKIKQFTGPKISAVRWQGDTAYFFKGDQFIKYDVKADKVVAGYPKPIKGNWQGPWSTDFDAAALWGNDKAYVFKEKRYIRFDVKTGKPDLGYPRAIASAWSGVWADGVDAAVPWTNGKVYFFKGYQYIQYDVRTDKADAGYPKPIEGNWPGVWITGIDAAVQWNADKAYFFKDDQYIRYDVKANKADPGYPKLIKGNWPGIEW